MNRPPAQGPELAKEDALDEGLDTLAPLTPSTARALPGTESRPPWGRLEGFSMVAVLRLLAVERKTCTLTIQEGGRRALLHLREGAPVHAESGSSTGQPALDDLLGWLDPIVSIARLRYEGAPTFEPRLPLALETKGAAVEAPIVPVIAAEGPGAAPGEPIENTGAAGEGLSPYARLMHLAEAGETGEFVAAREDEEFHVHLQRGRVVWVAGGQTRDRFRQHLLAVAGTRDEELQPVLEECRRSRLPLVETLVRHNLATPEQLRETFAAVFRDALADLRTLDEADCVFLRRGAEARQDMSFALRGLEPTDAPGAEAFTSDAPPGAPARAAADVESPPPPPVAEKPPIAEKPPGPPAPLVAEKPPAPPAPATAEKPPAPKIDAPSIDAFNDAMTPAPRAVRSPPVLRTDTPAEGAGTLPRFDLTPAAEAALRRSPGSADRGAASAESGPKALTLATLTSALEAEGVPVEGVCLTRGLAIVPGPLAPTLVPSPGLLDLMGGPAADRAELVILRAPDSTVIGQRIGGRPLVAWCRTHPEAYASAQALLARLGGSSPPASREPARTSGRALRLHHDQLPTDASAELTKLFTDNVDLISALIVDGSSRSYLAVDGPSAPPLTWMLRRALSSAGAFGPPRREAASDAETPPLLGARFIEGWWFGGPLLREPGHYGWLLLQPAAAQALGWLMAGRFCRRFGLQPLAALDA